MHTITNKIRKELRHIFFELLYGHVTQFNGNDNFTLTNEGLLDNQTGKLKYENFEKYREAHLLSYQKVYGFYKNFYSVSGQTHTSRPGKDDWEHPYEYIALLNTDGSYSHFSKVDVCLDVKNMHPKLPHNSKLSMINIAAGLIGIDETEISFMDANRIYNELTSESINSFINGMPYGIIVVAAIYEVFELIFLELDYIFTFIEGEMKLYLRQLKTLTNFHKFTNPFIPGRYLSRSNNEYSIYMFIGKNESILLTPKANYYKNPFSLRLPSKYITEFTTNAISLYMKYFYDSNTNLLVS